MSSSGNGASKRENPLVDFLISLYENYYSSETGSLDEMESVFMKCSYLTQSLPGLGLDKKKY